jgi:small subunit ribosomal protein S20
MRTKSAKKALRQSKRHAIRNIKVKESLKEAVKEFKRNPQEKLLAKVYSIIDTAAKKHIIHQNKAARLKSHLARLLKKTPSSSSRKRAPGKNSSGAKMKKSK